MLTVGEIVETINDSGLSLEKAHKEGLLPANVKTIRKLLKENGYDYNRKTKQWQTGLTVPAKPADLLLAATIFLNDDELKALKQLAQQVLKDDVK